MDRFIVIFGLVHTCRGILGNRVRKKMMSSLSEIIFIHNNTPENLSCACCTATFDELYLAFVLLL